jgi:hypothetical protein
MVETRAELPFIGDQIVCPQGLARVDPNLESPSRRLPAVCSGYRDCIHISARELVQPFFVCASNHSIEPGWGALNRLWLAGLRGGFCLP